MPPFLNGMAHKKIGERSRRGGCLKRVEEFHVFYISIPEPPFQNLINLHNLNASGVSPSQLNASYSNYLNG